MIDYKDYKALVFQVNSLNHAYYNLDKPIASDEEYDKIMQMIKKFEKENPKLILKKSPTQFVGGSASREVGNLVEHKVKMDSLEDVFELSDVGNFTSKVLSEYPDTTFTVEEKIDGLSIALVYKNGQFIQAITRGDGLIGEDVTNNVLQIKTLVQYIEKAPEDLIIRGEIYMSNEAFNTVNEKQIANGEKPFANSRNCAAGTLRHKMASVVKDRGLSMFIFNVQDTGDKLWYRTHYGRLDTLKSLGLPVVNSTLCRTKIEILAAIDEIGRRRANLSYGIDGVVIKVNEIDTREKMGATNKFPKWAIAYKFPPEDKTTILRSVEFQVGRTGRITPVANFDGIELAGTTVSKATLHNEDYIKSFDLAIGDRMVIYKSGDIIPKVRTVFHDNKNTDLVKFPTKCPICNSSVKKDGAIHYCKNINYNCTPQIVGKISHFVSRDCLDIKGLGDTLIERLVSEEYLSDYCDLFELKVYRQKLIDDGIIGREKNTDKLLSAIEESKFKSPDRILAAMGIPNIGRSTAKKVLEHTKTINKFLDINSEEFKTINSVEGFGDTIIESVKEWISKYEDIIDYLRINVFDFDKEYSTDNKITVNTNSVFSNKKTCITGTFTNYKRKDLESKIVSLGGTIVSSVTKNTDYLIVGDKPGSKLIKAESLKISVIFEPDFTSFGL